MSDYLVQQILSTGNIEVRLGTEIVGGEGRELLEQLAIRDGVSGRMENIPARLLFVLIGASPNTGWVAGAIQCDKKGFIATGRDVDRNIWPLPREPMTYETSVPGIFAVGDVRRGSMKRVASAVGEGAGAVQNVHQFLEEAKGAPSGTSQHRIAKDQIKVQSTQ